MKRKTIIRSVFILFVTGIVSAGLMYKFVINKPHRNYENARPVFIVSAADLFDSFQTQRQEAEKKFNGQVILLNGKLDKVEVSNDLVTGVFVFNQGMFGDEGVRCTMLPNHSASLKSLPVGTPVQVKGFLTGYNETDVILEQCSVIRL